MIISSPPWRLLFLCFWLGHTHHPQDSAIHVAPYSGLQAWGMGFHLHHHLQDKDIEEKVVWVPCQHDMNTWGIQNQICDPRKTFNSVANLIGQIKGKLKKKNNFLYPKQKCHI